MNNTLKLNSNLEPIAWGAFFILWGVTEMFKFLPAGTGTVGIGLILIGLNAARLWKGFPISGFTTTIGMLALLVGGLELARPFLHLSFEIPVFPIFLLLLGVFIVGRELVHLRKGG
jgi:hypothetical protein